MLKTAAFAVLFLAVISGSGAVTAKANPPVARQGTPRHVRQAFDDFDVVIAGGTTGALAAAIAACDEGARVALLEPTDWPGGQLTATGVPAVDESGHPAARDPRNMSPLFRDMLARSGTGGSAWVSRYCFEPKSFLAAEIEPLLAARKQRLVLFRNTVVKRVECNSGEGRIIAMEAIQRIPTAKAAWKGYDQLPSVDLSDWYDRRPSARFDKRVLQFRARRNDAQATVFIDATDWGEVLVLSDAPYLQGFETIDGEVGGNDQCGQATVFGFVQTLTAEAIAESPSPLEGDRLGFGQYTDRADAWEKIWTYRRIRGRAPTPQPGDLSLQNWDYWISRGQGGNDYPFGYVLLSKLDARAQRDDWRGGVDLRVLAAAEQRAFAWHRWYKEHAPAHVAPQQVSIAIGALGTGHGLSKLPYIRDTRRSVGLDGFVFSFKDITSSSGAPTGTIFTDRVALGAYPADIHPLAGCNYPAFVLQRAPTLPYYIPFRALTNQRHGNLLVAGKTMAQSFLVNSSTRVHPVEWSSGTAAGVAAAKMSKCRLSSRDMLTRIDSLQERVRHRTPIDWSLSN